MRSWIRDHGLLLANLALFVIFFGGMIIAGLLGGVQTGRQAAPAHRGLNRLD